MTSSVIPVNHPGTRAAIFCPPRLKGAGARWVVEQDEPARPRVNRCEPPAADAGGRGPKQADAAHPLTSAQRSSLSDLASKLNRTTG